MPDRIHLSVSRLVEGLGGPATQAIAAAATLDAARNLGIDGLTGSLEPGKVADVLIVEGAADRDVRALRRPLLVVAAGRPIQPTPPPAGPGPLDW